MLLSVQCQLVISNSMFAVPDERIASHRRYITSSWILIYFNAVREICNVMFIDMFDMYNMHCMLCGPAVDVFNYDYTVANVISG